MSKINLKIIKLYTIGLVCIVCYYLLDNSSILPKLVQLSEKGRYGGFPTFFLTGLFKYGLLVLGIGIIIIMSFQLIRERIQKN